MAYEYSSREYHEMVRCYTLSGGSARGAVTMYREQSVPRLTRQGLRNPRVPNANTIVAANQRLLDYGQFTVPRHLIGGGGTPLSHKKEDVLMKYFERNPCHSTNDAARRFGLSQYFVWKTLKNSGQHQQYARSTYLEGGISDAHDSDSEDEVLAKVSLASRKQSVAGASAGTTAGNPPQDTQRCDACRGDVAGPRYVCVECPYTQCRSCEFKGAHAHHYMLRVPGARPEEEVERIVRVIQMELADIMSGSQPDQEPEIIKTEIKVETEPDPLDGVCEDLEPAQRVPEQTTAAVDFEQEIDNSADSHSNLPSRKLTSASNKRMASPERAASAAKIHRLAASGDGTVKTEVEEMQSYEVASGSNANGGVTSDEKQTRPQRGKPGRQRKGSAVKKKVKQ